MTRNEESLQALFSNTKIIKSSTGTIQCVYVSDIPVSSWNKELALSAIKNHVTNYGYYEYDGRKGCCIVGDFDDIYNFIESNGYTVDEDYIYHWKEFNWDSAKKLDKRYSGQDYWNRKGISNSRRPIKSSKYYTSHNNWKYNTSVLPVNKREVMSFFENGSWNWDDTIAIVGEVEGASAARPAVIFGSKGKYEKLEKGTGLFNDQSWNDIGYFSFHYYNDNPDVFEIPNCRYFVLK